MRHCVCLFLMVSCLPLLNLAQQQLPPNRPEQDCINALPVCQDQYFQPNSYTGAGQNPYEINGTNSCMLIGERNSVWYVFTVQTSGLLCFTITPVDTTDDYDWAVYNITATGCSAIPTNPSIEVACNWTYNMGCEGRTGANGSAACPGQNEPCLVVQAGETYVLNVSNFTASNAGYLLDLSPSTATLYDDIPPTVTGMRSTCDGVAVTFSEGILCGTVDPADFTFTGPGGTYTVADVRSTNCAAGGGYDTEFELVLSPRISQAGNYSVALVGYVTDNCSNNAVLTSRSVYKPQPPVSAINSHLPQCQDAHAFGFAYTGPSLVSGYQWSFGDGNGSSLAAPVHRYATFGNLTVSLAIIDQYGCRDTSSIGVEVYPRPDATFEVPDRICEQDTITLRNLTTPLGNANVTRYQWRLGDGTTSAVASPVHTFSEPGRYYVLLEAWNTYNCRDTFSRMLTILPAPDVSFVTEDNVCYGDTANLLYTTTIRTDIAGDSVADWYWNWGDGLTSGPELTPAHLYDTAGVYPVTLIVTSSQGCTDSLTQDQIIWRPAQPQVVDSAVCFSEIAFLEAIPREKGGRVFWYTQPGDTAWFHEGPVYDTPPVAWPDTFYTQVLSIQGCLSEWTPVRMRHHEIGEGRIVAQDSVLEFPDPLVNFSVTGTILADQYQWNLGDGYQTADPAPAHTYGYAGIYEVIAEITDIYGCPYRLSRTVEIKNYPKVWVPSAFSPNADGINDECKVYPRQVQSFELVIYARTGQEVFRTQTPEIVWGGLSPNGKPMPEGVYMYQLRGMDYIGNPIVQAGSITLIR
ncbi:MAG: PKD domain-containing protein [Bacteroidia bacterium]|nr:PKD domain-containing protein [Bacteroidia bacterium]